MSDSEVITIMVMFHQSRYRDLKAFYINYIQQYRYRDFPHTVSYNRFVKPQQKALLPMTMCVPATVLFRQVHRYIVH